MVKVGTGQAAPRKTRGTWLDDEYATKAQTPPVAIIASTGVRSAELKRAERADVELERKAWIVRTARAGSRGHSG
jgi:integrase